MSGESRGPWFWILGGCGCVVVVGVIAVALLVWSGSRMVKQVVEQMEDPTIQRATASSVLGGDGLPAGYESELALRIPLVGDFVVLEQTDPPGGDPDEGRIVIFMRSRMLAGAAGDASDAGTPQFEEMLQQQGWRIDRSERLGEGRIDLETFAARWTGYRGRVDDGDGRKPVVLSLIALDCRKPDKLGRVAMWLEPTAADDAAPEGSVVDPSQIESLLRQLDPCPAPD